MPLSSPDGYLDFTNAVPRAVKMVATSNVGIGTSSPKYALDVHGTSNTGPLTVSSLTIADGNIVGDVSISGNLALTSNVTTSVDSNVVVEHKGPHSRLPKATPLRKYPEIVFEEGKFDANDSTNTYTQAGYTVTASNENTEQEVWKMFDDTSSWWYTTSGYDTNGDYTDGATYNLGTSTGSITPTDNGHYVKLELPYKLQLSGVFLDSSQWFEQGPKDFKIYGSNNGVDWSLIQSFSGESPGPGTIYNINSTTTYKSIALVITAVVGANNGRVGLTRLKLYGYEEDPPAGDTSIDTTFTSVMNTPQTGGVKVYVDGPTLENKITTGPTPTSTGATYDSTGKYWSITSNIAVEANTFMSGDQPHSVSVWFNSSNLEANVSNTCVFSISDQEHLNSQNLDLQSNTWHNLTYAYQGEGGSRVTYLDGRKVAEDQAEDTFGDYPPFAMTGYSQGGYVVSASNEGLSPYYLAWYAFDALGTNNNSWTPGDTYSSGTPFTYPGAERLPGVDTSGATIPLGEWLKLQLPHKLILSSLRFNSRSTSQSPKDFKIYGSNDDYNWDLLLTGVGTGANPNANLSDTVRGDEFAVNATKGYKYLAMSVQTVIGSAYMHIADLRYYGHRENDLVRLPDPTNVLEYPHIAVGVPRDTPAKRGYVVTTGTSIFSGRTGARAFDDQPTGDGWETDNGSFSNQVDQTGGDTFTNLGPGGGSFTGHWIQLEMPHKLKFTGHIEINAYVNGTTDDRRPDAGAFLGSNDGSNWYLLHEFTSGSLNWVSLGGTTNQAKITTLSASNTNAYKYVVMVITKKSDVGTSTLTRTSIRRIRYYGTGVDSIPIQIGGGNIDKVANFRVYDKFIDENQALEIWDAQKDGFGRAKSSMTLHKGRLGIGTTEPEGRLVVADEPHNLEEFPPRAMTDYKTYFEGHGEFCVSSTYMEEPFITTGQGGLGKLFDKGMPPGTEDTHFYRGVNGVFDVDGYYTGSDSIGGIMGDWVRIDFPYRAKIQSMNILTRSDEYNGRAPRDGYLLGKNSDEDEWTIIHEWTGALYYRFIERKFTIEASKYYSSYALVATRLLSAAETGTNSTSTSRLNIGEWRLFGTREQGQSVLHDGQLTLTKNLNVPRIGPAFDVDDTPRRDRLVVEYNTTTNPTFGGAVRDTSGRRNDGVFYGGATYDATEKSLTSSGTTGEIRVGSLPTTTITQLSLSFWINPSGNAPIFYHGYEDIGRRISFSVDASGTGLFFAISSNYIRNSACLTLGRWQHVSVVFLGGSIGTSLSDGSAVYKLYIDGADKGWNGGLFNAGTLQLENGHPLVLLNDLDGASGTGAIKLSNFKYHDVALTAEEVKTLYDMGRCDEGHHVVNFSKTRVGIGLGDGEAPVGALDVRGVTNFRGAIGYGNQPSTAADGNAYPDEFPASPLHIHQNTYPGQVDNEGIRFSNPDNIGRWNLFMSNNNHFRFAYNGAFKGWVDQNDPNNQMNFTGQHRTFIKMSPSPKRVT
jgi:hypothetical protein